MTLLEACVWMFASVYSKPQHTSSGEWFTGKELTIAVRNRTIPMGARYFISYGNRTVPVRVTDRGPFKKRREIDLSERVAKDLHFPGLGKVCMQRIE